jgi:hypothetical protein
VSVDVNPLMVTATGLKAVDGLVITGHARTPTEEG